MKGRLTTLSCLLLLTFVFLTLSGIAAAEVLHKWVELQPDHSYQYGNTDEDLFYTYTSKDASRSESGGSWQVTGSASASATARAPLPRGQDWRTAFDAHALVRATGDRHTLEPHDGDGLAETADGADKPLTSSDGTTTANTIRKAHVVSYQNRTGRQPEQRFLDVSTSGGKSKTSSSPSGLDADPWASSWLEARRRVALNEDVPGSPFTSTTPKCSSSGNGHTCKGYTPPGTDVGHCERGAACQTPETSVRNRPRAHIIKCPERTHKQGNWRWFLIKWKEDCKGEKWSCHSNPDNCTRSHLHLKPASEASANEQVIDGYVVPAGYSVGACGEHLYNDSSDHTLQASCSATNRRGKSCTVTNFYACQSHTHTYPKTPLLPLQTVRQRCLNTSCSKGGYTTGYDTHRSRCRHWHTYWDCDPAAVEKHKARTCVRCSNTYRNCDGARNPCISGLGHTETVETSAEAPSTPQPNPSPPSETPPTTSPEESDTTENEEQETEEEETTEVPEETAPARPTAVCGSGHTYFTNVSYARNQHQDRTCLRCSQTYQKCSNHGTACQNRRWHTQDDTAYMEGACGHSHRINEKSQHASVTCTTTNANGDTCTGGSYYACRSHTHTYPAPTTPTPPPSPPENSDPNDNEDEEEEEEEEEVPAAPPAPTVSYHPCGQHLTTVSGNHSLQASCSRDSNCIASSFYWCQHSSHTYPAPTPTPTPTPPTTVTCGAASWTGCTTDVSSSTAHQVSCSGGHSYWTCGTASAWHQDRTCTRCSQTYQNCGNSATACQGSKWHTETPQVVLVACGAASWTGCTSQLTSSTAHQVTCSGGHSYWTCGTANAWHKNRTCSRCSQTYQNCGNSATACQGSRWHTE